ncbi:MAG: hypothetical protein ACJ79S_09790 [Gemmatimonadaceae bacterium]
MRRRLTVTTGLAIALATLTFTAASARRAPSRSAPRACSAAAYRQFDFFAGDWDTYDVAEPTKVVARNRVTPMVGGCALREVYEQADGLVGESFSTYDAGRRVWHQSWVTNRGELLLLDGGWADGRMTFTATDHAPDGSASLLRVAWWPEGATVRERAERSRDGGATWSPVFDIGFRPHRSVGAR